MRNEKMSADEVIVFLGNWANDTKCPAKEANHRATIYNAVAAMAENESRLVAKNAELERLCDATHVAQGADAYNHACELMEEWQRARTENGDDAGCEGSLCDGLSWLHSRVEELEEERDALIAERDALREDAERWRHARKLLTIDDIEGAQGAYESFGRLVSEEECIRADSAIDAARTNEST